MKKNLILVSLLVATLFLMFKIDFKNSPKEGCPFCLDSVLSSQVFYKQEKVLALLTHKPAVQGHVLIIPERHVERFEDLNADEMAAIHATIQKVHRMMSKLYGNTDYLLLQKNGRLAGQSVPHVHFHYLPRYQGESHVRFCALLLLVDLFKPLRPDEIKHLRDRFSESIE